MKGSPEGEGALIARIVEGEQALFHDLIRPYERLVYMTAYALLKDEFEAEDAAQECLIKAYRALGSFRQEAKFSTWLVAIALNEARTRRRKSARLKGESLQTDLEEEGEVTPELFVDWREIPSEVLERKELVGQIESAINALPRIYREVFLMHDRENLVHGEIATALGITQNLVKVRLHRARMLLQKQLAPYLKAATAGRRRRWNLLEGGAR